MIGIIGPKTHGKSWVASQLGPPVMALADPIKHLVHGLYTGDKEALRPHYIRIGMAARRVDPDYWIKGLYERRPSTGWLPEAVARAYGLKLDVILQVLTPDELYRAGKVAIAPRTGVIVDDVRFQNEADVMDRVVLVASHEPDVTDDPTESGWHTIRPDWWVCNDEYVHHDIEFIRRRIDKDARV